MRLIKAHTTIATIDYVLDVQRQILAIGHNFSRFLADHPDARELPPHAFAPGSIEREVLTYLHACIAGDADADAARGTLFSVVEGALPSVSQDEHPEANLTKAEGLQLLADAQSNIDVLTKIRDLLAPLLDGTPAPSIPRAVDKPQVKVVEWAPDEIVVGGRLRKELNEDKVREMMDSIRRIGLQTPPSIRIEVDKRFQETAILVSGLHRLEACKRLGFEMIECRKFYGNETEARKWEIAENLHRGELTTLERAEHITEWIRLTEVKQSAENGQGVLSQVETKPQGGRPESGIRAAARELKIDKNEAYRAAKIASIAPAAKEAAADAGIGDNQKTLLAVARAEPEQQVQAVEEIVQRKAQPVPDVGREFSRLMTAWNAASGEARRQFMRAVVHNDGGEDFDAATRH